MPANDAAVYRALTRVLGDLFTTTASLSDFLHGVAGRSLVDHLPAVTVPLVDYVAAVAVTLERHGLVHADLFQALADARPSRFAIIDETARTCGVAAPTEPPRSASSGPRLRIDRSMGAIAAPRLLSRVGPLCRRAGRQPSQWLVPGMLPAPRQDNPAALLNARHGVVPFHTWLRAGELAALRTWYDRDEPVAVTVVAGPGGVGKTRLMLELCERARADGYVAGFVPSHGEYEDFEALFTGDSRVLAIVDYAETRPAIGMWLARATTIRPRDRQRTRVVLVVRSLDTWWDDQLKRSNSDLHALLRRDRPILLTPEALDHNSRRRAYRDATAHFAGLRGVPVPTEQPDLGASRFGRVLYLHMAALATVEGRPTAVGSLLADTLRHEQEFWSRQLPRVPPETDLEMTQIQREADLGVAAVAVAGGTNTHEKAGKLLMRAGVGERLRIPLLARLGDLYPGTREVATGHAYLSPLEPDLLAEAHVAAVLLDRATPPDLVSGLFVDEGPEVVRPAFQLIGRLASDPRSVTDDAFDRLGRALRAALADLLAADLVGRAPVALEVASALAERQLRCPLAEVLADALQRGGTPALAGALALQPFSTAVALRPIEEWVLRTVLAGDTGHQQRFAALVQLAAVSMGQEDREGARVLLREAVASAQAWVAEEPAALWPSALGIGLLGLADGEVGEQESAVERARDSLRCFEALLAVTPGEEFEALSLLLHMMYGLALLRSGARVEAVGVFRAMEPRYARLADERPGVQIPEQALCDFYLGLCLGEAGHHTESTVALRRAVHAQRKLVQLKRGSRLVDLAWSLLFLCEAEERLGENEAALSAGREAVGLWEELQSVDREAAGPGLALALCAVASVMHTVGDNLDAHAAAARGVELWRVLAEQRPRVFTAPLVAALSVLGIVLNGPGDRPAALMALDEALALARPLAERAPEAFSPLLGRCLLLQGLRRAESGDDDAAADALRASLATFRALPGDNGAGFTLEWGLAAVLLSAIHGDRDEYADVIAVLSEVLAVMKRAPDASGPLHGFVRGSAHVLRAMALTAQDEIDAAVAGFSDSLAPLRTAKDVHPDVVGFLALALAAVARDALNRDDPGTCEALLLEAIPLWRACIAAGESNADELADDLLLLAQIHHGRDDADGAHRLLLEAEGLLRSLSAAEAEDAREPLAECLALLADLETNPSLRLSLMREAASLFAGLLAEGGDELDEHLDRVVALAEELAELGHLDEAAAILDAAVVHARASLSNDVDELLLSITDALEALIEIHAERDAPETCLKHLRESAGLWRARAANVPDEHRARFVELLRDLREALAEHGHHDEAREVAAELRGLRNRGGRARG